MQIPLNGCLIVDLPSLPIIMVCRLNGPPRTVNAAVTIRFADGGRGAVLDAVRQGDFS